jgi:hypothetical protein
LDGSVGGALKVFLHVSSEFPASVSFPVLVASPDLQSSRLGALLRQCRTAMALRACENFAIAAMTTPALLSTLSEFLAGNLIWG